jgi:hypothetical protein
MLSVGCRWNTDVHLDVELVYVCMVDFQKVMLVMVGVQVVM